MSQDLYSSLSGAFGALRQIDVIANNIANVHATGFKRERLTFEAQGPDSAYARIADGLYDPADGVPRKTGNPLDVALQGPGWFVVGGPDELGNLLTRDGQFQVDANTGALTTHAGLPVLGEQGTIIIEPGQTARIDRDGTVWADGEVPIGRLRVVEGGAEPLGGNLWRPLGDLTERDPTLVSGSLESSNVDPALAMIELIQAGRLFETLQNVMRTSDELDERLNQFGRGV